jgi:hypothetical protein
MDFSQIGRIPSLVVFRDTSATTNNFNTRRRGKDLPQRSAALELRTKLFSRITIGILFVNSQPIRIRSRGFEARMTVISGRKHDEGWFKLDAEAMCFSIWCTACFLVMLWGETMCEGMIYISNNLYPPVVFRDVGGCDAERWGEEVYYFSSTARSPKERCIYPFVRM